MSRIDHIYVEVQNTFDDKMMKIPIVRYIWSLSPDIVCNKQIDNILDYEHTDIEYLRDIGLQDALRFIVLSSNDEYYLNILKHYKNGLEEVVRELNIKLESDDMDDDFYDKCEMALRKFGLRKAVKTLGLLVNFKERDLGNDSGRIIGMVNPNQLTGIGIRMIINRKNGETTDLEGEIQMNEDDLKDNLENLQNGIDWYFKSDEDKKQSIDYLKEILISTTDFIGRDETKFSEEYLANLTHLQLLRMIINRKNGETTDLERELQMNEDDLKDNLENFENGIDCYLKSDEDKKQSIDYLKEILISKRDFIGRDETKFSEEYLTDVTHLQLLRMIMTYYAQKLEDVFEMEDKEKCLDILRVEFDDEDDSLEEDDKDMKYKRAQSDREVDTSDLTKNNDLTHGSGENNSYMRSDTQDELMNNNKRTNRSQSWNYYHLTTFIKLMKQQAHQFNQCESINLEIFADQEEKNLRTSDFTQLISTRIKLARYMKQQTKTFSFKQLVSIKDLQDKYIAIKGRIDRNEDTEQEDIRNQNKALKEVVMKWSHESYCWLYLNSKVIKLMYSSLESIPESIRTFYSQQLTYAKMPENSNNGRNNSVVGEGLMDLKTQEDFINHIIESFWDFGKQFAIKHKEKRNNIEKILINSEKRFQFTKDNYHKLRLIMQRAELEIPVLLIGESGCGKTFMVEFISQVLMEDMYEPFTFHSGVSEVELKNYITKCIEKANGLEKGRRLWMFLDEINTTPLVCQIGELITERRSHILDNSNEEIPKNIVIISACNPFTVRMSADKNMYGSGNSILTHKVYPLPQSILPFAFNYGQLSESEERHYIDSMLSDASIKGLDDGCRHLIVDALAKGQSHIRSNDHESAASIRDVKRFIDICSMLMRREKREYTIQEAVLISIYCCYSIRQKCDNDEGVNRTGKYSTFNEEIEECLGKFIKKGQTVEGVFMDESTKFIEVIKEYNCIPYDIADNRPLLENVFIAFHCVLGKIPLFICGRPGTSKTVAIQIVERIFALEDKDKEKSDYLFGLPKAKFYPIWGSKGTTANEVKEKFDDVKRAIEKERDNMKEVKDYKETIRVIVFDEIGVADTNEQDPLKVLHPLLEPRFPKDKVGFIGLSNSVLDASKMNRMLYVQRFEMGKEELEKTLKAYKFFEDLQKKVIDKKFAEEKNRFKFVDWLVESYVKFRVTEVKDKEHNSFYGPRDFYALGKWINAKGHLFIQNADSFEDFEESAALFFCIGIERNFSGRMMKVLENGEEVSRNSSYYIKKEFLTKMSQSKSGGTDISKNQRLNAILERKQKPIWLISMNLSDNKSRHLMVFIKQPLYIESFFKSVQSHLIESLGLKPDKVVFLNEDQTGISQQINNFSNFVSKGFTVMMRGMESIYPSLYDLFNQRYSQEKEKDYCIISYGSFKTKVEVHKEFRCIVIMDDYKQGQRADVAWPPALLNRFEKHILLEDDLLDTNSIRLRKRLSSGLADVRGLKEERYIHNYSSMLLESLVVSKSSSWLVRLEKFDHDNYIKNRIKGGVNYEAPGACEVYSSTATQTMSILEDSQMESPSEIVQVEEENPDTEKRYIEMKTRLSAVYNSNYLYHVYKCTKGDDQSSNKKRKEMMESFDRRSYQEKGWGGLMEELNRKSSRMQKCVVFSLSHPFLCDVKELLDDKDKSNPKVIVEDAQDFLVQEHRENHVKHVIEKSSSVVVFRFRDRKDWGKMEGYKKSVEKGLSESEEAQQSKKVVFLAHCPTYEEVIGWSPFHFMSDWELFSLDQMHGYKSWDVLETMYRSGREELKEKKEERVELLKEIFYEEFVRRPRRFENKERVRKVADELLGSQDVDFYGALIDVCLKNWEKICPEGDANIGEMFEKESEKRGGEKEKVVDFVEDLKVFLEKKARTWLRYGLRAIHRQWNLFSLHFFITQQKSGDHYPLLSRLWISLALTSKVALEDTQVIYESNGEDFKEGSEDSQVGLFMGKLIHTRDFFNYFSKEHTARIRSEFEYAIVSQMVLETIDVSAENRRKEVFRIMNGYAEEAEELISLTRNLKEVGESREKEDLIDKLSQFLVEGQLQKANFSKNSRQSLEVLQTYFLPTKEEVKGSQKGMSRFVWVHLMLTVAKDQVRLILGKEDLIRKSGFSKAPLLDSEIVGRLARNSSLQSIIEENREAKWIWEKIKGKLEGQFRDYIENEKKTGVKDHLFLGYFFVKHLSNDLESRITEAIKKQPKKEVYHLLLEDIEYLMQLLPIRRLQVKDKLIPDKAAVECSQAALKCFLKATIKAIMFIDLDEAKEENEKKDGHTGDNWTVSLVLDPIKRVAAFLARNVEISYTKEEEAGVSDYCSLIKVLEDDSVKIKNMAGDLRAEFWMRFYEEKLEMYKREPNALEKNARSLLKYLKSCNKKQEWVVLNVDSLIKEIKDKNEKKADVSYPIKRLSACAILNGIVMWLLENRRMYDKKNNETMSEGDSIGELIVDVCVMYAESKETRFENEATKIMAVLPSELKESYWKKVPLLEFKIFLILSSIDDPVFEDQYSDEFRNLEKLSTCNLTIRKVILILFDLISKESEGRWKDLLIYLENGENIEDLSKDEEKLINDLIEYLINCYNRLLDQEERKEQEMQEQVEKFERILLEMKKIAKLDDNDTLENYAVHVGRVVTEIVSKINDRERKVGMRKMYKMITSPESRDKSSYYKSEEEVKGFIQKQSDKEPFQLWNSLTVCMNEVVTAVISCINIYEAVRSKCHDKLSRSKSKSVLLDTFEKSSLGFDVYAEVCQVVEVFNRHRADLISKLSSDKKIRFCLDVDPRKFSLFDIIEGRFFEVTQVLTDYLGFSLDKLSENRPTNHQKLYELEPNLISSITLSENFKVHNLSLVRKHISHKLYLLSEHASRVPRISTENMIAYCENSIKIREKIRSLSQKILKEKDRFPLSSAKFAEDMSSAVISYSRDSNKSQMELEEMIEGHVEVEVEDFVNKYMMMLGKIYTKYTSSYRGRPRQVEDMSKDVRKRKVMEERLRSLEICDAVIIAGLELEDDLDFKSNEDTKVEVAGKSIGLMDFCASVAQAISTMITK